MISQVYPKVMWFLEFDLHALILVLVSLESHKSILDLDLVVRKTWFRHALEQLASVSSKHVTDIALHSWLGEEEPSSEVWKDLDVILSTDIFKPLIEVNVACIYKRSDGLWYRTKNFERSKFPTLLPTISKRGILIY